MKKRIGTKLYDTETSELCKAIEEGKLYRKKTRDREYFFVYNNGMFVPLLDTDISNLETNVVIRQFNLEPQQATGTCGYQVRVDKKTHDKLRKTAKEQGMTISKVVKNLVSEYL